MGYSIDIRRSVVGSHRHRGEGMGASVRKRVKSSRAHALEEGFDLLALRLC